MMITKTVEIAVTLKYLSNFWKTLEIPLINCEIYLILTLILTKSVITDTKLYVPIVTLSTQDNAKLLEQLKSGFKRTINWNKYQSKVSTEIKKQYLDLLIDPSFQEANRLFVLFENEGTLNVKLSNPQLNKLKSGIKYGTEKTLKLSSNVVGNSNDEYNFPH